MTLYVIDNGAGYSDHVIYFVETDQPLAIVEQCAAAVSSDYYQHKVCAHGAQLTWLNEVIWRRMSLESYLSDWLVDNWWDELTPAFLALPVELLRGAAEIAGEQMNCKAEVVAAVEKAIAERKV